LQANLTLVYLFAVLRRLLTGLAVAVLLAGCSSGVAPTGPAPASEDAAFPVTVPHGFGETVVPAAPQRVVSLGYTEQDAILAFGVVPVAMRYAFGPEDDPVFPWADAAAVDARPAVLPREEIDFEQVAALQPDLIMAVTAGLDRQQYDTLSRIAPTVVQPAEFVDFGTPWQEQTRVTGLALGQPERAEQLVAQVEARFAEVTAAHPELAGRSLVLSGPMYDGTYPYHATDDTRTRFFGALGMVVPPELDAAAGESFFGTVSRENASMLDADVLVWQAGSPQERAEIEGDPILAALPVVREGRALFVDGTDYDALQFSSVLSLPHLLDEFVPRLAAAARGTRQ
jgi:iron complex transport system substrate-binding protein